MVRSGMRIAAAVTVMVMVSGCGSDGSSAPKSPLTFDRSSVASPTMVTTSAFPVRLLLVRRRSRRRRSARSSRRPLIG